MYITYFNFIDILLSNSFYDNLNSLSLYVASYPFLILNKTNRDNHAIMFLRRDFQHFIYYCQYISASNGFRTYILYTLINEEISYIISTHYG